MSSGSVAVRGLRAGYQGNIVLDIDELDVRAGEFLSILGPSGCGKSTLLNTIAGFVDPDAGSVLIDGNDVTRTPAHRRDLGLVFQNYALFPHLTVQQNLTYGLKVRKIKAAEQKRRVDEMLELVGLVEFADRRPRQLSGGQQQRVALARALAYQPSVLLLDEPLSNLDAKLRRQMQSELRQIQRRVGTTMIFVTHDQDEALTMSDRVALLSGGRVEQLGTPEEVYRHPQSMFVADFLGAGNIVTGQVESGEAVTVEGVRLPVATGRPIGSTVTVVLRREHIELLVNSAGDLPQGRITYRAFAGSSWNLQVQLADGLTVGVELSDRGESERSFEEGRTVWLRWDPSMPIVIDG